MSLEDIKANMKAEATSQPRVVAPPRFEEHSFDQHAEEHITTTVPCMLCGGTSHITVSKPKYLRWKQGTHIQEVWPNMDIGVRETMISGSHSDCFDEVFRDDDQEAT